MQVKDLKPGDQFAGVVSETRMDRFAYESITVELAGGVLPGGTLILPPDVKMGVGQLGMFEVVRRCDLCGDGDECNAVLVNLVGEDEPKWA